MKRIFIISILTCVFLIPLAPACNPFQLESPPSSLIEVKLVISHAPRLNEPAEVTCTVSSRIDIPNSTAEIKLPEGAALVDGSLEWQGDLKAGLPVSFSVQIVFKETGNWDIEAVARHMIDEEHGWSDLDVIYLTVGTDHSEFGWPPEPDVEDLPPPPTTSLYD